MSRTAVISARSATDEPDAETLAVDVVVMTAPDRFSRDMHEGADFLHLRHRNDIGLFVEGHAWDDHACAQEAASFAAFRVGLKHAAAQMTDLSEIGP